MNAYLYVSAGSVQQRVVLPAAQSAELAQIFPWKAGEPDDEGLARTAQDYEAILAVMVAGNAARTDRNWEPDTPEYAAERTEIAEALLDEQLAIITRTED